METQKQVAEALAADLTMAAVVPSHPGTVAMPRVMTTPLGRAMALVMPLVTAMALVVMIPLVMAMALAAVRGMKEEEGRVPMVTAKPMVWGVESLKAVVATSIVEGKIMESVVAGEKAVVALVKTVQMRTRPDQMTPLAMALDQSRSEPTGCKAHKTMAPRRSPQHHHQARSVQRACTSRNTKETSRTAEARAMPLVTVMATAPLAVPLVTATPLAMMILVMTLVMAMATTPLAAAGLAMAAMLADQMAVASAAAVTVMESRIRAL